MAEKQLWELFGYENAENFAGKLDWEGGALEYFCYYLSPESLIASTKGTKYEKMFQHLKDFMDAWNQIKKEEGYVF